MMIPRLRALPWPIRLSIALLMLVAAGGLAASWTHIYLHHSNRDEAPGLSYEDVAGAYHGVKVTAPLLKALDRDHPPELPSAERAALRQWLTGSRVNDDYDNADLGDMAPAEIIARSCLRCHARAKTAEHPIAAAIPLDYFDDVRKLATSREIKPMEKRILVMTTHTHALALVPLTAVAAGLMLLTCFPRPLRTWLALMACLGLALDVAGWWLTRQWLPGVWMVIVAGGVYNGAMGLMVLLVLLDVLRPGRALSPSAP